MPFVAEGPERAAQKRPRILRTHYPRVWRASTLERETGIEPATNSLEGCDSTTELLPQNPAASYQLPAKPQRLKPP